MKVVLSSGHGFHIRGAVGPKPWGLDEVDEARRVVSQCATDFGLLGDTVITFDDESSRTQSENLKRIVDFHNAQTRDLDISVHFNAFQATSAPRGTEVLWVTQQALATRVSANLAQAGGFINRGAKKRSDLYFLNNTKKPAILIEVCFVDSQADAELYKKHFRAICSAIAASGGEGDRLARQRSS